MNGLIPPGYYAVLLGAAASIEDLSAFTPLEEGAAEGTLVLVRLDFTEFPSEEALLKLEQACSEAGVERWPGYAYVVYVDIDVPSVYLAWQKGIAWIPIIIGLVATTILPPLLGSLIWWLLPQGIKDMITGLINMGMMLLVMFIMMQLMKPLTALAKPKQVKTSSTKPELEEAKA
jgi:hypothetical protein